MHKNEVLIPEKILIFGFWFLLLAFQNVVVFPSRSVAIENALQLFSPRLAIVDERLAHHLPRKWLTSLAIEVNCVWCATYLFT